MRSFLLLLVAGTLGAQAPLNPKLHTVFPEQSSGFVTDVAGVLKNPQGLTARLQQYRDRDTLYINVVTLPTIGSFVVEDVAREIGRTWKVAYKNDQLGAATRNTGVVVLLVMDSHKCRVEVARGSEGYLTDSRAAEACRGATSDFRAGDFDAGLASIVSQIAAYHQQELAGAARPVRPASPPTPFPWGTALLVLAGLAMIAIPVGLTLRKKAAERRRLEEEKERRQQALRQKQAAKRAAEEAILAAQRERARLAAEERERLRWAALTPEQQAAERAEQARLAAERRQAEAEAAARRAEEAARRAEEAAAESRRRTTEFSSSSYDYGSSSSSSDSGSSSGGSDSFGGGGGGSSW